MIDEALIRYRHRVEDLHGLTGAGREVERRINDAIGHVQALMAERARIATPRYRDAAFGGRLIVVDVAEQLASLDTEIATAEGEIGRLRAEHARIQRRRDGAARIAGACRDLLVTKFNLPPRRLEF